MGAAISGDRATRVAASPNFDGKVFVNRDPSTVLPPGSGGKILRELLFGKQVRKPSSAVPIVRPSFQTKRDVQDLNALWLGHATTLLEIEGHRVLLDPVWSLRCSPTSFAGPKRLHPMPLSLAELPALDAIVISHDHYDHLDMPTVRQLTLTQMAPFLVPLGVGAHLERWKVPADRIIELDWNEEITVGAVKFVATEARHFSGRSLRRNDTLWGSWVIAGKQRRVFYTGDTGYFPGFAEVGSSTARSTSP